MILPLPAVMPAQAAPAPQAQAPAAAQDDKPARLPDADLVPYGSRVGMNATIVERRGIGTANARVRIVHTEANAKAFCVEYSSDHSQACVRRTMRGVRLRPEMTANCRTGAFTGPFGTRFQFRGKRRDASPEYSIVDLGRREELDGSGASGYSEVLEQYAALCGRPR